MERLSRVVIVMVYELWHVVGCGRRIVGTLIIYGVCYSNSLIWGCGALWGVLRRGFELAGIGVGVGDSVALGGVYSGREGYFWRVGWGLFWRARDCGARGLCRLVV